MIVKTVKETTRKTKKIRQAVFSHDSFFKDTFSNPKRAKKLLEFILSKKEFEVYDINKIRIEKDSFKEGRHADIILSLPFKKNPKLRARIFILLEHKSQYDKGLFEQILNYIILLRKWVMKLTGRPPLIIPVLFYHGKQPLKWAKSLQEEEFKQDFKEIPFESQKSMLNYEVRIINTKDPKVRNFFKSKGSECWGFIRLLDEIWNINNPDKEKVRRIIKDYFGKELKGAKKEEEEELTVSVIRYLQSAGGLKKQVWKEAEKLLKQDKIIKGGDYMGAIENIREEGLQKGLQKGRQEGRQERDKEVVLNLLKKNQNISFISEVTGLPEKEIKKLKNGS